MTHPIDAAAARRDAGGGMAIDTIGCEQAEAAFLSCLLHLPHPEVARHLEHIAAEDLVDPRHRLVLLAIERLVAAGQRPDPVLVLGELRRTGDDTSFLAGTNAGGVLADLAAAAPVVASCGHYLGVVLEHAWRRRVEAAGVRLQQAAGRVAFDDLAQTVIDELQHAVDDLRRRQLRVVA
jgi:replicative DNA helicase